MAVLKLQHTQFTDSDAGVLVRLGCHPHLVRVLGRARIEGGHDMKSAVVAGGVPNALVMEYAKHRDLATYLCYLRDLHEVSATTEDSGNDSCSCSDSRNDNSILSLTHRLLVCSQVAQGMIAIHEADLVHREVMTRNVMVFDMDPGAQGDTARTLVKISGYGFGTAATVCDNGVTPMRYLAPETIKRRLWSKQSDVWAFGVLMWEVFSDGEYPYGDVGDDATVARKVREGSLRLERPPLCPDDVWGVVLQCWHPERLQRPSFVQIIMEIQNCLTKAVRVSTPSVLAVEGSQWSTDTTDWLGITPSSWSYPTSNSHPHSSQSTSISTSTNTSTSDSSLAQCLEQSFIRAERTRLAELYSFQKRHKPVSSLQRHQLQQWLEGPFHRQQQQELRRVRRTCVSEEEEKSSSCVIA